MVINRLLIIAVIAVTSLLFPCTSAIAKSDPDKKIPTLKIAVAANFATTIDKLLLEFAKTHPHTPQVSVASTGVLYQQIRHGAPFDIFFAADIKRPALIEEQNLVFEQYRKTYAIGQIALWSATASEQISFNDLIEHQGRIALAAPHIAPYGRAAKQALMDKDLWGKYHNNIIVGNNINQTLQQTLTGAVKYGFISYSQLLNTKTGFGELVDINTYEPIEQQMVVLKNAQNIEVATKLFEFILSTKGQKIIAQNGYLPAINVDKNHSWLPAKANALDP